MLGADCPNALLNNNQELNKQMMNEQREREGCLQATDHDGEHGGYSETTVGQTMANEIATVP